MSRKVIATLEIWVKKIVNFLGGDKTRLVRVKKENKRRSMPKVSQKLHKFLRCEKPGVRIKRVLTGKKMDGHAAI